MENLDKVADLLYNAYDTKQNQIDIPKEYDDSFKSVLDLLNEEQRKAFYNYHTEEFCFLVLREKNVIKYILGLLCPEC